MPCLFPGCASHPQTNGYCIGHQIYAGAPVAKKKNYRIPQKSAKKLAAEKQEKDQRGDQETDLQKWYQVIMKEEKAICWETDKILDKKDTKGWHGSIAHILPKKLFPSVATHPLNYLILSMWGGAHGTYDSSWAAAQRMKVWPKAVERFKLMFKDIADNEKKYIPDCLLIHLPETDQI